METMNIWIVVVVVTMLLLGCSVFERYEAPYSGAELESSTNKYTDELCGTNVWHFGVVYLNGYPTSSNHFTTKTGP